MLNPYESGKLLAEYLLFIMARRRRFSGNFRPRVTHAIFRVRCVQELIDSGALPARARALDVGCSGRTLEL